MKKLLAIFMAVLAIAAMACSGPSGTSSSASDDYAYASSLQREEADALAFAQVCVMVQFATDAEFLDKIKIEPTEVEHRYKILQQFESEALDGKKFTYRIWVQKFPSGWEYGNFGIEDENGTRVLTDNGDMKKKEALDGVGDKISAGGIEFTIAEKKSSAIRIYTDSKLSRAQLKSAISDLMDQYETIQFATTAKHGRGEDYASWTANMFFDYDKDEIISKKNFF